MPVSPLDLVMGDKLGGIALHIGARVAASARGGEVLVSSTVKNLVAASRARAVGGGAGAGPRLDLARLGADGHATPVKTVTTNADGRTHAPLLEGDAYAVGRYERVFHVGAYFTAAGVPLPHPPFLNRVPVRFATADTASHHHVPLLVSPWSYTTYRGS